MNELNKLAAVLLVAALVCLTAGGWMITPAVGLLIAGVTLGVAGVANLDVQRRADRGGT